MYEYYTTVGIGLFFIFQEEGENIYSIHTESINPSNPPSTVHINLSKHNATLRFRHFQQEIPLHSIFQRQPFYIMLLRKKNNNKSFFCNNYNTIKIPSHLSFHRILNKSTSKICPNTTRDTF